MINKLNVGILNRISSGTYTVKCRFMLFQVMRTLSALCLHGQRSQQKTIINAMAVNEEGVMVTRGDNGSMSFWDWKSGHNFQQSQTIAQPDTIKPVDVGLKEEAADDDRGLGFFGANQLSRVARWAKPITYVDIHESDSFTMCMFCFPTSSVIPLHDHPGMTVFSKLLYGSLHVKAYDWVEPPCIVESKGPGHAQVRLAKLAVDKVLNAPCETSVLYPNRGGNIHCFTAVTPCAMLDVLAPPYKEYEGRKCTYYHDYPYSTFSAGNGSICDGEEDEYAWLAEVEPSNLYMNSGVYAGPAIKL